jgi:hypothetical protein
MKIEEHERGGGYDVWVSDSMPRFSRGVIECMTPTCPSIVLSVECPIYPVEVSLQVRRQHLIRLGQLRTRSTYESRASERLRGHCGHLAPPLTSGWMT